MATATLPDHGPTLYDLIDEEQAKGITDETVLTTEVLKLALKHEKREPLLWPAVHALVRRHLDYQRKVAERQERTARYASPEPARRDAQPKELALVSGMRPEANALSEPKLDPPPVDPVLERKRRLASGIFIPGEGWLPYGEMTIARLTKRINMLRRQQRGLQDSIVGYLDDIEFISEHGGETMSKAIEQAAKGDS